MPSKPQTLARRPRSLADRFCEAVKELTAGGQSRPGALRPTRPGVGAWHRGHL